MNYLRTAILLAGLTALFMGVGYLIGGSSGVDAEVVTPATCARWRTCLSGAGRDSTVLEGSEARHCWKS